MQPSKHLVVAVGCGRCCSQPYWIWWWWVLIKSQLCCQNPHWRLTGFQGKPWSSLVGFSAFPPCLMCSISKSPQTSLTQLFFSPPPLRSHPPGSLQLNSLSFSQRFGESGNVSAPITHVWALIYPLPAWGCCAPASQNAKWVVAAALSPALPGASERDPQPGWGCSEKPAGHPRLLWDWQVLCAGQVTPLLELFGFGERRGKVRPQSLRKKSFVAWIMRGGFMQRNTPYKFGCAIDMSHCLGSVT